MPSVEEILAAHTEQDRESFEKLNAELKAMRKDVAEMRNEFSKYKGFIGGVVFVVSAIGAALGLLIAWMK